MSLLTGLVRESFGPEPIPTALIAHEGDRFLGTVSVIACDEETRPHYTPWVAALWVEPDHRQKGIGAALVDKAVEHAISCGAGRVHLLSGPHRRSFYEQRGWSVLEAITPEDEMFILVRDAGGTTQR